MSIIKKPDTSSEVMAGNADAAGYIQGKGNTVAVTFFKASLAATEAFALIDLSDTANFHHTEAGKLRVYSISVDTEKATDGQFIISIGVVTEVDATDGSVYFVWVLPLEWVDNPTDSTDSRRGFRWSHPYGLDLEVDTVNDNLEKIVTNATELANVRWQTDVALDSPRGDTTVAPGEGDLVMLVDMTGGAGTVTVSVVVEYIAEA